MSFAGLLLGSAPPSTSRRREPRGRPRASRRIRETGSLSRPIHDRGPRGVCSGAARHANGLGAQLGLRIAAVLEDAVLAVA